MSPRSSTSSHSAPVHGFRLALDRHGTAGAPPVVLLHGWPGSRRDYRAVVPLLTDVADVAVLHTAEDSGHFTPLGVPMRSPN